VKVSALSTDRISEICITSSRAATRGAMFLPFAGGRRDEGVVMPHQLGDQRRDIFRERLA
jgi:hypothetical protein